MRGVALVAVVLSHLWIVWPSWVFAGPFARGGFVGVDLFFVLSGFLITTLLLTEQGRTGTIRLRSFYWRRALRLLPALWLLLVVHAIYAVSTGYPPFGNPAQEWTSVAAASMYVMNWHVLWNPKDAADLVPTWSLAIEGQFYLVWPLVVLGVIGLRRRFELSAGVLLAALAAVSVWRLVVFDHQGWSAAYLRSDTHIDGLLLGSLVGCAWVRGWTPDHLPRWLLWPAAATATAVLLRTRADSQFAYAGGTTVFILAAAVILLVVVSDPRQTLGPVGRGTAFLGRMSYGIYLWHFPALWAFSRWGTGWGNWPRAAGAAAVTVAGVAVSRHFVELPALRLKPRVRPPATPARASASAVG